MMNRIIATVVAVVIAAALFRLCAFIVDQKHYAIVFELGHINRVISEPGLHFKLPPPFQNVEYLDKRILTIDPFVKWRIADARNFWISFHGGEREAEDRITTLLRDALNQAVNKRTVNDITSRERDKAMEEIRAGVQERVRDLGVKIVDVRLKRVDFIPEASESVFHRMESERKRVANEQRSNGAADAEKIRADADRQREVLLAEAYRDAQRI